MTLLFVVDDGKTTAIIVEDRPRRRAWPPASWDSTAAPPPPAGSVATGRRWPVLSRCESASQLDPDLIYNYHAAERIRRLHHLIAMHRRSVTASVNLRLLGLGFSIGL